MRITTAVVHVQPKDVSSWQGHRAARTSPFYQARLDALSRTLALVRQALKARDFRSLGQAVEREAVSMHVVAMTSHLKDRSWLSGVYYWQPETLALMHAVQRWRGQGLEAYFTVDAGPNVHLLCESSHQAQLEQQLDRVLAGLGGDRLVSAPGRGAPSRR